MILTVVTRVYGSVILLWLLSDMAYTLPDLTPGAFLSNLYIYLNKFPSVYEFLCNRREFVLFCQLLSHYFVFAEERRRRKAYRYFWCSARAVGCSPFCGAAILPNGAAAPLSPVNPAWERYTAASPGYVFRILWLRPGSGRCRPCSACSRPPTRAARSLFGYS